MPESKKCPQCGQGDLVDVNYFERSPDDIDEPIQLTETRQVETYSCGHEVVGGRLDRTSDELEVEHRTTDETVDPL